VRRHGFMADRGMPPYRACPNAANLTRAVGEVAEFAESQGSWKGEAGSLARHRHDADRVAAAACHADEPRRLGGPLRRRGVAVPLAVGRVAVDVVARGCGVTHGFRKGLSRGPNRALPAPEPSQPRTDK